MFDSHCHLQDVRLLGQAAAVLARAQAAGVDGFLLAGVDAAGWRDEAQLAALALTLPGEPQVALSYGVHPQVVATLTAQALDQQLHQLSLAARGLPLPDGVTLPVPQAIGELGLDAYTKESQATLPQQERALRAQLALARELDLPLVLHILRTHEPTLRILQADGVPKAGGVVHSYSGSAQLVPRYVRLGLSISFAGALTLPGATRLAEAARAVPSEHLLVETDAPDQTPVARRPAHNEPAFLPDIIEALAILRAESPVALRQLTAANARRLFRFTKPPGSVPAVP